MGFAAIWSGALRKQLFSTTPFYVCQTDFLHSARTRYPAVERDATPVVRG